MSFTDVMIDLEYLASSDNAVITQIAMIPFDIDTGYFTGTEDDKPVEAFNCSPHIQEQLQRGRTIDADTLSWWMNECALAGQTPCWLDDSEESLDTALVVRIPAWNTGLFDWNTVRVWSSVRDDMPKMHHAYANLRPDYTVPIPWSRKNEWHLQTVRGLAQSKASNMSDEDLGKYNAVRAAIALMKQYHDDKNHDALWDCVTQIREMTLAWEILHGE